MTHDRDAGRLSHAHWIGMLLLCFLATGLLTLGLEWQHYRGIVHWEWIGITRLDGALLFLLLWGKSLLLTAPVLALAALPTWRGRSRAAWALLGAGVALVLLWLVLDIESQARSRRHLFEYLEFARDPGAPDYIGGAFALAAAIAGESVVALGITLALALACGRLTRWLVRRHAWMASRRSLLVATLLFALPIVATWPAQRVFSMPVVLVRLAEEVPVPLPFLGPSSASAGLVEQACPQLAGRIEDAYRRLYDRISSPPPPDDAAPALLAPPPHVVLIVLESFRHDALAPEVMPRLSRLAERGLRLERHYAGSNCSHPGLFALLYGRMPLMYHRTLDRQVPPQLPYTMRRLGYQTTYIATTPIPWQRMEEFLNPGTFDRALAETHGWDWWEHDRAALERVGDILARAGTPQFVVTFLMGTHFPYYSPVERRRFFPICGELEMYGAGAARRRAEILNRYRNAAAYADAQLGRLLDRIDLRRTIVVVTGDHGEAVFEDGTLAHGGKLSEIETRVPMVLAGPGIPTGSIASATTHADLLPTLLHALAGKAIALAHVHGRDRLDPTGAHEDQVLLVQMARGSAPWYEAAILRRGGRLALRLWLDQPRLRVMGLASDSGDLSEHPVPPEDQVPVWVEAAQSELERLAR